MARRLKDSPFRSRGTSSLSPRGSLKWFLLLALAIAPFLVTAKKPVHDFEGKCALCHLTLSGGKRVFVKEIDFLCTDCHTDLGLSHPSGMKPSMLLPAEFPLDWTGKMTCATCHEVHGGNEALLRGETRGRAFCYACHKGAMEGHAGSGQPAHSRSAGEVQGFEVIEEGNPIDRLSLECLSCHDSALVSSANVKVGSGIWNHGNGNAHPVGVAYMKAYRKGGFRHPVSINPSIRLFDGRIGCGSCHNIYSKEKFYLAISNRGSALCLECHKK